MVLGLLFGILSAATRASPRKVGSRVGDREGFDQERVPAQLPLEGYLGGMQTQSAAGYRSFSRNVIKKSTADLLFLDLKVGQTNFNLHKVYWSPLFEIHILN